MSQLAFNFDTSSVTPPVRKKTIRFPLIEGRQAYAREVEAPPSRFTGDGAYSAWAARADVWAKPLADEWERRFRS